MNRQTYIYILLDIIQRKFKSSCEISITVYNEEYALDFVANSNSEDVFHELIESFLVNCPIVIHSLKFDNRDYVFEKRKTYESHISYLTKRSDFRFAIRRYHNRVIDKKYKY